MSDEKRGRDPRWEPIDRALGGRFRDGAECPEYVFDLLQLARAEAAGQPLPDTADFLREHFHVCPVCRRIYRSVLAAARESSEPSLPDRNTTVEPEPTLATALTDGAPADTAAAPRPWRIPVRWDEATVRGISPPADLAAELRVIWTAEHTVQLGPRGFLLPGPGERLELTWTSADGIPLCPVAWIEGEKTFVELADAPRAPQSGDGVRLRRLDKTGTAILEVHLMIP